MTGQAASKSKIAVTRHNVGAGEACVRWMIRRDMSEVLEIEQESFGIACWTEEDFLAHLRLRTCIGMVVEHRNQVIGFMLYELFKTRLNIINLAVATAYRRQGICEAMLEKLKDKLSEQGRTELTITIRESNLSAQMFLREQGFVAVNALRNHYENCDAIEDGYVFRFRQEWPVKERT